ncbi:hypothetical protein B9Z55_006054 [Caenorhabditis nigoni]|uniref:Uncharacterized protein n=1 Tax=Caenorhabditis nigoni TaxID=1611254 RepID=A0A2G5V3F3_9PELO|nr:hypothetical protein B9Z55_006054 [Caenorhabditis nigoni]
MKKENTGPFKVSAIFFILYFAKNGSCSRTTFSNVPYSVMKFFLSQAFRKNASKLAETTSHRSPSSPP